MSEAYEDRVRKSYFIAGLMIGHDKRFEIAKLISEHEPAINRSDILRRFTEALVENDMKRLSELLEALHLYENFENETSHIHTILRCYLNNMADEQLVQQIDYLGGSDMTQFVEKTKSIRDNQAKWRRIPDKLQQLFRKAQTDGKAAKRK